MASTATSTPLSLSSSSALINAKAPSRPDSSSPPPTSHFVTCPSLPPVSVSVSASSSSSSSVAQNANYRKIGRNVAVNATSEVVPAAADLATYETPEIVKTIQEAWNKVEDKYAVSSLAVAGGVALCSCFGAISAIDKLPLIPGVLELIGIGYSGIYYLIFLAVAFWNDDKLIIVVIVWFAYRNLIFKPERDALICKIKETYKEIIGSS